MVLSAGLVVSSFLVDPDLLLLLQSIVRVPLHHLLGAPDPIFSAHIPVHVSLLHSGTSVSVAVCVFSGFCSLRAFVKIEI